MSVSALEDYTFVSRYSRYNKEKKRRHTWEEAVEAVKNMHLKKYPNVSREINWAFGHVKNKLVLGSQRALQFAGRAIEKINARIFNCTSSFCDRLKFFQEAFWLLLCGSGTGFSVQKHHVKKLPSFDRIKSDRFPSKIYQIADSIEGWSDSLGVLVSSYFQNPVFPEYTRKKVIFDYSEIRPEGSYLSSCDGKAPGPEPLRKALENITNLLDSCLERNQTKLRPIDAYDIVMHCSDAVLSGGIRRAATISIFSPDDEEMMNSKVGNWFYDNPQRGRSNNSVRLLRKETSLHQFSEVLKRTREFGEPGISWGDSTEGIPNPCHEVEFWPVCHLTNLSGWSFCNLCEINGKKIKTREHFQTAAKAAAIIGTLQAGYTDFPYLGEVTERIVRNEALLGVGITGMMENASLLLDPETQIEMAKLVLDTNEIIANKIGINLAARATLIKPSGSTSCLLGTSSGIHPHHARKYLRRVQGNIQEDPLKHFKKINPLAVEKSVWSKNGTDEVISFCIKVGDNVTTKSNLSALDMLEVVKNTQQNWVLSGTRPERCVKPWLRNNVSNTIVVKEGEWEGVKNYIYENRDLFGGVSLLPETGDLDYQQAPMVTILDPEEIFEKYGPGSIFSSGLIVDGLHAFDGNLWTACDIVLGVTSETKQFETNDVFKVDWVRRAKQFAVRYFDNDFSKMCYCLKQVSLYKTWLDLKREYKDVDYTECIEEIDNTNPVQELACSGSKCEVM